MYRPLTILTIVSALLVAGCSPNAPAPSPAQPAPAPQPAPAQPQASAQSSDAFPTIPEGALYTLYCLTITTPTHIPDAEHLKEQLIAKTGLHNWYVVHGEGQSILFYGYYKTYSDDTQPLEKARAQSDRSMISQLKDDSGNTPFAGCGFQPISSPDPDAPPEWDLRHASGFWALQIGSYTGSQDRKKYAVDAVRAARAQGINAYYYHGKSVSSVLIGTWPREAVKEQDTSKPESDDPNKVVVVLDQPLPAGFNTQNAYTKDGRPAKIYAPRVEIQDPTLLAAMKQYPANAVNGEIHMRKVQTTKGIEDRPDPSFLVMVPHEDQAASGADQSAPPPIPQPGG